MEANTFELYNKMLKAHEVYLQFLNRWEDTVFFRSRTGIVYDPLLNLKVSLGLQGRYGQPYAEYVQPRREIKVYNTGRDWRSSDFYSTFAHEFYHFYDLTLSRRVSRKAGCANRTYLKYINCEIEFQSRLFEVYLCLVSHVVRPRILSNSLVYLNEANRRRLERFQKFVIHNQIKQKREKVESFDSK